MTAIHNIAEAAKKLRISRRALEQWLAALNARDLLECADALPNPNAAERDMEAGR